MKTKDRVSTTTENRNVIENKTVRVNCGNCIENTGVSCHVVYAGGEKQVSGVIRTLSLLSADCLLPADACRQLLLRESHGVRTLWARRELKAGEGANEGRPYSGLVKQSRGRAPKRDAPTLRGENAPQRLYQDIVGDCWGCLGTTFPASSIKLCGSRTVSAGGCRSARCRLQQPSSGI